MSGRIIALLLGVIAAFAALAPLPARAEGRTITAYTEVTKWGQMPGAFEIRGQALPGDVDAADFAIAGEASAWGATENHPFSCGVQAVEATADGWRLIPERFPDKYFYVRAMDVTCEAHPELSFTLSDIGGTVTPTADDFTWLEDADHGLNARVFACAAEGPQPVVIVFHGYGDTDNLLTYRTAVAWAEPAAQAVRPCTVIAPVIESGPYFYPHLRRGIHEGIIACIDGLIAEGKADPDRVYAMGNSFGGMAALELAEQYPDRIAAVLALCPALNYADQVQEDLPLLAGKPVFIAQAEHDETIPVDVGRAAAQALLDAGSGNVLLKIYTDEEMTASGAALGFSETYSFHHVELAVMEDASYAEWLFSQRLSDQ